MLRTGSKVRGTERRIAMEQIGRFAPSPSGRMHLGNVFSAMLAWLSIRSCGGKLVLRIEDLDPDRCRREYADQLKRDLEWLGLTWDEEQTPQSLRSEAYRGMFSRLEEKNLVYPCYCSRVELHAASAPHASDGTLLYAGTCRNLTPEQRATMTKKPSLRIRLPDRQPRKHCRKYAPCWRVAVPDEDVSFTDGLQGAYTQNLARACGDFIVRRADGVYAYQLAVVTDDAQAGVTQVVRGSDLLSSTPRQIWLQRQLGFPEPGYYHVPLLVAPDGRRLSKREKDLDMGALRNRYTPEQLLGMLAHACGLLSHSESVRAGELAEEFSWQMVQKENIVITNP